MFGNALSADDLAMVHDRTVEILDQRGGSGGKFPSSVAGLQVPGTGRGDNVEGAFETLGRPDQFLAARW
jgi:hypothetical protein